MIICICVCLLLQITSSSHLLIDLTMNALKLELFLSSRWACQTDRMASEESCQSLIYVFSLIAVIFISFCAYHGDAQQVFEPYNPRDSWNPWRPPWESFDRFVHVETDHGDVKGFSVPMYLEDEYWREDFGEYPMWFMRRVNCFLGVPYALPPVGYFRFRVRFADCN